MNHNKLKEAIATYAVELLGCHPSDTNVEPILRATVESIIADLFRPMTSLDVLLKLRLNEASSEASLAELQAAADEDTAYVRSQMKE